MDKNSEQRIPTKRHRPVSPAVRCRLEVQGFTGIDGDVLAQVELWLRLSPALCTIGIAAGVVLRSPLILAALAATAMAGTVFPAHPFDFVYNCGIRRVTKTPALPPNGPPRRFACAMAAVFLSIIAGLFSAGYGIAAYVLGGVLIAMGTIVSVGHLCIPSMMYHLLLRVPRRG